MSIAEITNTELTERQRHELEYYEKYSTLSEPIEVNFDPISGAAKRPWNSYWHFIEKVERHFRPDRNMRLLDFGCGTGFYSIIFARIGYHVHGFDIAPNNISIANDYARKYGLADKCTFTVSVAETLEYPDEYFDVVTGINILHHVDIANSVAECMRVLKEDGIALFHEPVRAPLFDRLRESKLGTSLVSKEASFDRHITQDERKLSNEDFSIINRFGSERTYERFLLLSRLDRFVHWQRDGASVLEQIDQKLFRWLPFVRGFGGECVITVRK